MKPNPLQTYQETAIAAVEDVYGFKLHPDRLSAALTTAARTAIVEVLEGLVELVDPDHQERAVETHLRGLIASYKGGADE